MITVGVITVGVITEGVLTTGVVTSGVGGSTTSGTMTSGSQKASCSEPTLNWLPHLGDLFARIFYFSLMNLSCIGIRWL